MFAGNSEDPAIVRGLHAREVSALENLHSAAWRAAAGKGGSTRMIHVVLRYAFSGGLGATAGLSSSGESTVGQANRGTQTMRLNRPKSFHLTR